MDIMTNMKGFKKNRHELAQAVVYLVEFETGYTHEIKATSARDAEIKTMELQGLYGRFISAQKKGPQGPPPG